MAAILMLKERHCPTVSISLKCGRTTHLGAKILYSYPNSVTLCCVLLREAHASIIHIILADNISGVKCICNKYDRDHNCQCAQVDPSGASALKGFTWPFVL